MTYVLSYGTNQLPIVGDAVWFLRSDDEDLEKGYTYTLGEAMEFDNLADAERVACSSRVYMTLGEDKKEMRHPSAISIWDAELLRKAINNLNTVTTESIRDSVGFDKVLIKKVDSPSPWEAEDLSLVLREISQKKRSALKR